MVDFVLTDVVGNKFFLHSPAGFSCSKSMDSPADSLSVSFFQNVLADQYDGFPEIKFVQAFLGNDLLFDGICDEQSVCYNQNGACIELAARGLGALLLDNEACPQEYSRVSMDEIFQKHVKPYGFFLFQSNGETLPIFTVSKGMSQWDVFSSFCKQAVGKVPYVSGDTVLLYPDSKHVPGIQGDFLDGVVEVKHTIRRCDAISTVFLRDEDGRYSAHIKNNQALDAGISRTRYLIPSPQWVGKVEANAALKLKDSMASRNKWYVKLAGIHNYSLGDFISLQHHFSNLQIVKVQFVFNQLGWFTKLSLA